MAAPDAYRGVSPKHAAPGRADLDTLIGEVRAEAARRRSSPDFPLIEDADFDQQLAERAPRPPRPLLERLASEAEQVPPSGVAPSRTRRAAMKVVGPAAEPWARKFSDLARVVSTGLRTASAQLTDLETRVRRIEGIRAGLAGLEASDPGDLPGQWLERILPELGPVVGRVLWFAADPATVVGEARRRGLDAYGVASSAHPYTVDPDVRHGELPDHLRSVGDAGLGALVASGLRAGPGISIPDVAGEMRRVTARVEILGEAPWSWRSRVGDPEADAAPARPISPETWLDALVRAGFAVTADYGPGASTYRVAGRG